MITPEEWAEEFSDKRTGLCTLCGNGGMIDTTGRAVSPAGWHVGRLNFCICPNGRARQKLWRQLRTYCGATGGEHD